MQTELLATVSEVELEIFNYINFVHMWLERLVYFRHEWNAKLKMADLTAVDFANTLIIRVQVISEKIACGIGNSKIHSWCQLNNTNQSNKMAMINIQL